MAERDPALFYHHMQDAKVYSAAILGFTAPGLNLFVDTVEPILKSLVLLGQFGVAAVTILYIFSKWKQISVPPSPKKKRRTRKR